MAFQLHMTATPILAADGMSTTLDILNQTMVRTVECGNLSQAVDAFNAYCADAQETGRALHCYATKPRRCTARKPAGFDKTFGRGRDVNRANAPSREA